MSLHRPLARQRRASAAEAALAVARAPVPLVQHPQRIVMRGGSGLGDALYVQSVARHFAATGRSVEVASDWPDVFRPLGIPVAPFRRTGVTHVAHYAQRRLDQATTQFRDCCISARVAEPVALRLDWAITDTALVETIRARAAGRPIVAVQLPRLPMNRADGYGLELLPDAAALQACIDAAAERALVVQVGKGEPLIELRVGLDLANRTSVAQLIDVAASADACITYVSFMVPLAESLGKPYLGIWSRRGLRSRNPIIAAITPAKIIESGLGRAAVDDAGNQELRDAAHALLDAR